MKSIAAFFCLISTAMAFAPQQVTKAAIKAATAVAPAAIAAPAFALDSIVEYLPTNTVALEVQFGAYLAVLFGTFLPCLFLVNLYIQTESRKAGKAGGQDSE
uniref:Photosystem II reaction center M protein n=1 Tax=Thalassionema nitzschioides TaxID=33649 RepID=A0A6V1AP72_9STRA|mmetsp:Transcript_10170/g.14927  ORF Transcript_10170/g.14927 Transcript_10170/m.14927 type:complete len:102 (+) Transcript_10170:92-397(+)